MPKKPSKPARDYAPGDKIFAKVKGFPHWPSRINLLPPDVPIPKGKYPIFFYGTHEVYFLTTKDIYPYDEYKERYGKPKPRAHFNAGLEEIENSDKVLYYGVDPRAQSFLSRFYKFERTDGGDGEEYEEPDRKVEKSAKKTPKKRRADSSGGQSSSKRAKVAKSDDDDDDDTDLSCSDDNQDNEEEDEDSNNDDDEPLHKVKKRQQEQKQSSTTTPAKSRTNNTPKSASNKSLPPKKRTSTSKPKSANEKSQKSTVVDDDSLSSISSSDSDDEDILKKQKKKVEDRKKELEAKQREFERNKEKEELAAVKRAAKELKHQKSSDTSPTQRKKRDSGSSSVTKTRKFSGGGTSTSESEAVPSARKSALNSMGRPVRKSAKNFSAKDLVATGEFPPGSDDDEDADSDYDAKQDSRVSSTPSPAKHEVKESDPPPPPPAPTSGDDEKKVSLPERKELSSTQKRRLAAFKINSSSSSDDEKDVVVVVDDSGKRKSKKKSSDRAPHHHKTVGNSDADNKKKQPPPSVRKSSENKKSSSDGKKKVISSSSDEENQLEKLKEKKKLEKLNQKKRGKLQGTEITTEAKLRLINREIKASLIRGQEDYQHCLAQLEAVNKMEIKLNVLVKCWELMDTIKKCRRYKQSDDVKMGAQKVFNKFLEIYATADKDEVMRAQVEFLKHQNQQNRLSAASQTSNSSQSNVPHPTSIHDFFHTPAPVTSAKPPLSNTKADQQRPPAVDAVKEAAKQSASTPPAVAASVSDTVIPMHDPHQPQPPRTHTPPKSTEPPTTNNNNSITTTSDPPTTTTHYEDILTEIPGFELAKSKLGLMPSGGSGSTIDNSMSHLLSKSQQLVPTAEPVATHWPKNPPTMSNRNRTASDSDPLALFESVDDLEILDTYESNSEEENGETADHQSDSLDLDSRIAQLMGNPTTTTTSSNNNSSSHSHHRKPAAGLSTNAPTGRGSRGSGLPSSAAATSQLPQRPGGPHKNADNDEDEIYSMLGV